MTAAHECTAGCQGPPLNEEKVVVRRQAQQDREEADRQREEDGRAEMELLEAQVKARVEIRAKVYAEMMHEGASSCFPSPCKALLPTP